ncbi:MAG: translation initiation factor IF-2 [Saprospiraceae bacterium]|nr:translation initiation factor IF-2 [Saprospiraceae bacterium]MBK7796637.1 translation initiation factor IF-2 [Saprospiraceae bacterium]MBL0259973.1 translation initiation factor IF-2 [Saprospiraceae bacterium]
MTRLLIKVATEFNLGLQTIVDHLQKKGFEIDPRPTAKVSDEMYAELLKEFQGSIKEKEQAAQLQKPATPVKEKPAPKLDFNLFGDPVPEKPVAKPKTEPKQEELIPVKIDETLKPKLKVVGKIELEKAEEKSLPQEEPVIEPPVEVITPPVAPQELPIPSASEEITRIKAPELKGLKILGKIDTNKLKEKETRKKDERKPNTPDTAKPNTNSAADAEKKKRKRKRKKIGTQEVGSGQNQGNRAKTGAGGGGYKKEEAPKEISQKQIEEKIKATMARLNVGGKNKRQKIRRDKREEMREKAELAEAASDRSKIQLTEFVTVQELSNLMDVPVIDVITTCMNMGIIVSINQRLDAEVIEILAEEFGHKIEFISSEETVVEEEVEVDDPADLVPRSPIVTVMGHVDHGKTSLLDYIRKTNVASGEAGGITQHIGAYEVSVGPDNKKITFLDTPGHEAFTAMRARGAKVTDVAVIIVAADDHIMPQTKEAISHAQAANVPIVFAINKIDKPGADPERIKNELSQMNFLVDSWGGKYSSQEISAKNGIGIEALLEKIILEAEVLDLKANPEKLAIGTVLEASLDKGRGYVAKLLVQNGTLYIGDTILAGEFAGKIKAMFNERGQKLKEAKTSSPVMVLGLTGAPTAGEKFKVMEDESEARAVASRRSQISREQANRASKRISLDEIGRRLALGNFKELKLIVKGDVDGSVEALSDSLIKLSVEKIQVSVIHKAVGQIIESDILLASASDAIVIGFQVRPSVAARNLAEKEGVEVKTYSIIYEAIEEIKLAMEGMLEPTKEEKVTGQVEVREVFKISKVGTVAGGFVIDGKVTRNNFVRVIRDGIVIYPSREGGNGELASLKRFKEDVKEVKENMECGISVKNFNDIKLGDIIEAYEITEVKQKL